MGKTAKMEVMLLRCSPGDAVSHVTRVLATLFVCELPFDGEGLSDVGKPKVVIEFGGGPDLSDFDSAMENALRQIGRLRFEPLLGGRGRCEKIGIFPFTLPSPARDCVVIGGGGVKKQSSLTTA